MNFNDESKYSMFGFDGRGNVWRKKNILTAKHGGGSVIVWGCMAATVVGNCVSVI